MNFAGILDRLSRMQRAQRLAIYGVLMVLMGVGFWALMYLPQSSTLDELQKQQQQLKASKSGPVHMLDELSMATPEKLQLQQIDEQSRRLQLTGVAVSNEVISQFLTNLEQSEYFDDVFLNAIDQVDEDGVKLKNFSISARLVVPGTDAAAEAPAPAKR